MNFWINKKVLVTGGSGFLGGYVVDKLIERGVNRENIEIPKMKDCDLREKENCAKVVIGKDIVIHLAAVVGGIGANSKNPAKFFYDNAIMGIQLIHESWRAGVKKFVALGTICSYPKYTPVPFREENLWDGYPEETNAPYGLAKKIQLVQTQAYCRQYGFNAIYLLPVNLYGPRDNFSPEISHVIPALIKKCFDAIRQEKKEIIVWGTGKASREFLYVEDCAEAILMAAEKYNKPDPVNIGAGFEISIKELVNLIAELTGFRGKIIWDVKKPDGQPRRMLDTSSAFREFGFKSNTNLREGLKKTIDWYFSNRNN
ncbi:GDP-L-fucose synthase [bacterium]|jgi:GDP-L-fucose synthase|nr:GDP-L-fucose synthase [bacterium]